MVVINISVTCIPSMFPFIMSCYFPIEIKVGTGISRLFNLKRVLFKASMFLRGVTLPFIFTYILWNLLISLEVAGSCSSILSMLGSP